jgi:mannose-6-phosphate isomerase
VYVLENIVQPYAWGSRHAIAELQGRTAPTETPEAELWMGAHPGGPSFVPAAKRSLLELTSAEPERVLGRAVRERFGGFPFLLKVLAADTPLSIQAHPSKSQAEAGFAEEDARGVPVSAPHRNYRDANHKPELLCAVTRFEALCGFRAPEETVALLDALAIGELAAERELIATRGAPDGIREAFRSLMHRGPDARAALLSAAIAACRGRTNDAFANALEWTVKLAELHPGDVGAVSALFLNHIVLAPGEAIYLPAGNLHAYLSGVGIEIMASSDNVLRGGLTPKHVDVPELLRVLDFGAGPIAALRPTRDGDEEVYFTPAPDFRLARREVRERATLVTPTGPEILFCAEGDASASSSIESVSLRRGEAVLILGSDPPYRLTGRGVVYRATVGVGAHH